LQHAEAFVEIELGEEEKVAKQSSSVGSTNCELIFK
jgi:hypothetical protein